MKGNPKSSPFLFEANMKYNYSYSGADCDVYATRNGVRGGPIHLTNISTVSISMYEAKAPVRRLGHAAPVGFTGNIRSIAGSLIFVVVREHPLREVMQKFGSFEKHVDDEYTQGGYDISKRGSGGKNTFNAGMILPFNLMLMYKNEVDKRGAGIRINNIEFISEGIVTSVNDMVTEVVLQFVATDIDQLELEKVDGSSKKAPLRKPVARTAGSTITYTGVVGVQKGNNSPVDRTFTYSAGQLNAFLSSKNIDVKDSTDPIATLRNLGDVDKEEEVQEEFLRHISAVQDGERIADWDLSSQ